MMDPEPFGAARGTCGAHHLALVTRGQVRAIWRQHRRIKCGHVNARHFVAHSHWPRACAGRAARHLAGRQGPSEAGNTLVLADTREHSKTVARSKLVAISATHDASLANSRVRAVKRVELFGLGNGGVRTLQQGRRGVTGKLQTRDGEGVAVEVAYRSGPCCCTRLGLVALCASGSAFFLQSETITIVNHTCRRDGGKTAL